MFDKDLMFLAIFGLRGYKHDLESQSGLHCAAEVYQALTAIEDIAVVSIGVTTGMTYCGVVGHVLRREYTVIGIPANKAARLMMAYEGKVTCDKETCLHSRMEPDHFVLQEAKELKGLVAAGQIFEFKETPSQGFDKYAVNKFPLLGRDKELIMFTNFLDRMIVRRIQNDMASHHAEAEKPPTRRRHTPPSISVLLIKGELRQGKSRLLSEMVYTAPRSVVYVNRIALSYHDRRAPYRCVQLMLYPAIGLSETSTVKEREDKLLHRLESLKIQHLLCCLNSMFNVSFDMTEKYFSYSMEERHRILMAVLKKLIRKCFKRVWVISIDDCEFVDEESWLLMPLLFNSDQMFIVMALGRQREISEKAHAACVMNRVRHVPLQAIDRKYHIGLACQLLDCRAIPPELEKEVRERSNGNPGWVESYLTNLMQTHAIMTLTVNRETISKHGLVVPPREMMVRTGAPDNCDVGDENDPAFKDMKKRKSNGGQVQICKLNRIFRLGDISEELSMDAMVIKFLDSLSSYEQAFVKNGSVLGETFTRKMVEALMPNPDERSTCLAVKHLFEMHVLGCAEGDFNPASNFMPFQPRPVNPNMDLGLRCSCQGIVVHKHCKDLPSYASCGFMRFHTTTYRETTYNLQTTFQKKEAHLRAVRYLETETMRCHSCGGGPFNNILGNKSKPDIYQMRFNEAPKKLRYYEDESFSEDPIQPEPLDQPSTSQEKQPDEKKISFSRINHEELWLAKYYKPSSAEPPNRRFESDDTFNPSNQQRRFCGILPVSGLIFDGGRSQASLTRSFSSVNFSNCQCELILTTMYAQLLEHCRGASDATKLMDAVLEYAAVSIAAANIPQANRLLDEALQLLATQAKREDSDTYDAIPDWKAPFISGKIHTLLGSSQLVLGDLKPASERLYQAMNEFGSPFPEPSYKVKLLCMGQMFKLKCILQYFPQSYIGRTKGLKATIAEHMSECLSLIFTLCKIQQEWQLAYLAAIWSLNISLQTDRNFFGLCTAYCNMLDVAHHYGDVDVSWLLENSALKVCQRVSDVQPQELEVIARLYCGVFKSRLHRGELDHGTSLGFKTLRITDSVHAMHIRLKILPPLIQALMMQCRLSEAVLLLQDLQAVAEEDSDKSALTWYHALAVDIQLDSGFCVIPYRRCEQFYQEGGEKMNTVRDPNSRKRFFMNMWLWCVRLEDWDAAALWEPRARKDELRKSVDDSIESVMTTLRMLEILLLILVSKTNGRSFKLIAAMHEEISIIFAHLHKSTSVCRLAIPRFMHMQAYYRYLRYHDNKSIKMLAGAKLMAVKQGNALDAVWMDHSDKVWRGLLAPVLQDVWKEQCDPEHLTKWHDAAMDRKMAVYTLPLARFSVAE